MYRQLSPQTAEFIDFLYDGEAQSFWYSLRRRFSSCIRGMISGFMDRALMSRLVNRSFPNRPSSSCRKGERSRARGEDRRYSPPDLRRRLGGGAGPGLPGL